MTQNGSRKYSKAEGPCWIEYPRAEGGQDFEKHTLSFEIQANHDKSDSSEVRNSLSVILQKLLLFQAQAHARNETCKCLSSTISAFPSLSSAISTLPRCNMAESVAKILACSEIRVAEIKCEEDSGTRARVHRRLSNFGFGGCAHCPRKQHRRGVHSRRFCP